MCTNKNPLRPLFTSINRTHNHNNSWRKFFKIIHRRDFKGELSKFSPILAATKMKFFIRTYKGKHTPYFKITQVANVLESCTRDKEAFSTRTYSNSKASCRRTFILVR